MEKSIESRIVNVCHDMTNDELDAFRTAIENEINSRAEMNKMPITPNHEQIKEIKESIQEESKALDKVNTFYAYETLGVNTYENYLHLVNVNQSKLLKTKGKNKNKPRTEYENLITVSRAKDRAMKGTVADYNIFISPKNLITLKIQGMTNGGIVSKATLIESGLMTDSSFSLSIHSKQGDKKTNSLLHGANGLIDSSVENHVIKSHGISMSRKVI
jgi:hypothetical protein